MKKPNYTLIYLIEIEKALVSEDKELLRNKIENLDSLIKTNDIEVNKDTKERFIKLLPYIIDSIRGDLEYEIKISELNNIFRD